METILNLRVGELVEVRSREDILRTLDERGRLDSLPFMPEMLKFCGRRFRVYRRADKACDTIDWGVLRRMESAVHLEGVRCDGSEHGGCEAGCLVYWKEAWLQRVSPAQANGRVAPATSAGGTDSLPKPLPELLLTAARKGDAENAVYSCQATELLHATSSPLPWWNASQYVRDIRSGNATLGRVVRGLVIGLFNKFQHGSSRVLPRFTLIHGGNDYPFLPGSASGEENFDLLDLHPGDLVEVKSKEEILATLDDRDKTRGLRFDREMLRYCGRRGRVLRRVTRIVDEKSGKMLRIRSDCIVIDGFICTGDLHRFCPRSIWPYWRESWLKRVDVGREAWPAGDDLVASGAAPRVS